MNAPMIRWQRAVAELHAAGRSYVMVTLLETRGSAPRDGGSKMVVSDDAVFDTIGGGQLEFRAIDIARRLIGRGEAVSSLEEFNLGPALDQCCGGRVKILFECFPDSGLHIELHGAGHVGRALVRIFSEIDCRVRWIDQRPGMFPHEQAGGNVHGIATASAAGEVGNAPAGAWHLVITHSHPLDLEIVEAVLTRGDARYLGLIGSRSKAARFRRRLRERGFDDHELARLECPIGVPGVGGKEPMQIAVAVAADILRRQREGAAERSAGSALELVGG